MNMIPAILIFTLTLISRTLSIQVCGRQLADLLDLVCDGRGFNFNQPINYAEIPRISKRAAAQYLSSGGQRRGVVDECCHRACTLPTLESYCAAPSGTYFVNPTSGPVSQADAEKLVGSERFTVTPPPTTPEPTTPTTTTTHRPIVSNMRTQNILAGAIRQYSNRRFPSFFFVKPVLVGEAPTRSPVVS